MPTQSPRGTPLAHSVVSVGVVSDSPGWLKYAKDASATLQSLATILALVVGAWWVLRRRRNFPRAKFAHNVTSVPLDDARVLVHVGVTVENVGDVLMRVADSWVCLQQLKPMPPDLAERISAGEGLVASGASEIAWPVIASCTRNWTPHEIEPGETGVFHFDLIVPKAAQTVLIYSFFQNLAKLPNQFGWNTTTIYDMMKGESQQEYTGATGG